MSIDFYEFDGMPYQRLLMRWVLQPDQQDEYLWLSVISMGMMDWLWIFTTHGGDATLALITDKAVVGLHCATVGL